jgi:hypothetical protein
MIHGIKIKSCLFDLECSNKYLFLNFEIYITIPTCDNFKTTNSAFLCFKCSLNSYSDMKENRRS